MGSRTKRARFRRLAFSCAAVAALSVVRAAPPETPKPDFSGTWTLDREISTSPDQIEFAPAANGSRPQRGGIGGFGGNRGRRRVDTTSSPDSLTSVEQERLKALTDQLKNAVETLVISHHDPDFVVNDAKNHTFFLHTTGESEENHVGTTLINTSTHWDGEKLVTECILGGRVTLVYSYTLLPNTKQMVLRVARRTADRNVGRDVRLVYRSN
jgi:hypothetical protein